MAKLTQADIADLTQYARTGGSLTPVKAHLSTLLTVHLGFEIGTYETKPLCGALEHYATATTDEEANCGPCASVVRKIGLSHHLRDEGGWTGLYRPRSRRR